MPNQPLISVMKPSDVRNEANKAKTQQQEADESVKQSMPKEYKDDLIPISTIFAKPSLG
jgi:hypothetical protein